MVTARAIRPEALRYSTARIRSGDRVVGVGFLIDRSHLLTCAHVIDAALGREINSLEFPSDTIEFDFPMAELPSVKPFTGTVISDGWYPLQKAGDGDMALIRLTVPAPPQLFPVLLSSNEPAFGSKSAAIGFPAGYVDKGIWIEGIVRNEQAMGWLQVDISRGSQYFAEKGFSGTPVFNLDTFETDSSPSVIGMLIAVDNNPEHKAAYLQPATRLLKFAVRILRTQSPYRGLEPFQVIHAQYFFGREEISHRLARKVIQNKFVAVVGSSGSGKSSLVRAGLIPRLKAEADNWIILLAQTSSNPLLDLSKLLAKQFGSEEIEDWLPRADRFFNSLSENHLAINWILDDLFSNNDRQSKLLIIFDQFEQVISNKNTYDSVLDRFIQVILTIMQNQFCHCVIVFRSDYYEAIATSELANFLDECLVNVPPFSAGDLRDAIERPATKFGKVFQPYLVDKIIVDTLGQPGSLPFLQFALTQLWDKQTNDDTITFANYFALGGVEGAVRKVADEVYTAIIAKENEKTIDHILVSLVQPSTVGHDTRRKVTRSEIENTSPPSKSTAWEIVQELVNARLIVTDKDASTGEETVELAHESLINGWTKLKTLVEVDREFITWKQSRLAEQMEMWHQHKRNHSYLLVAQGLSEAHYWLETRGHELGTEAREFIFRSVINDEIQDLQDWLPYFSQFDESFQLIHQYLLSKNRVERIRAIQAMQWIDKDSSADVYAELERLFTQDSDPEIRLESMRVIINRDQIDSVLINLNKRSSKAPIGHLLDTLAQARNLPEIGKLINKGEVYLNFRLRMILAGKTLYNLILTYRNQLSIVLIIIYGISQFSLLAITFLTRTLTNFLRSYSYFDDAVAAQFDFITLLELFCLLLYLLIRNNVIDKVNVRQLDRIQVGLITCILSLPTIVIALFISLTTGDGYTDILPTSMPIILSWIPIIWLANSVILFDLGKKPRTHIWRITLSTILLVSLSSIVTLLLIYGPPITSLNWISGNLEMAKRYAPSAFLKGASFGISLYPFLYAFYVGIRIAFPNQTLSLYGANETTLGRYTDFAVRIVLISLVIFLLVNAAWQSRVVRNIYQTFLCSINSPNYADAIIQGESVTMVNDPTLGTLRNSVPDNTCVSITFRASTNGLTLIYVESEHGNGWIPQENLFSLKDLKMLPDISSQYKDS